MGESSFPSMTSSFGGCQLCGTVVVGRSCSSRSSVSSLTGLLVKNMFWTLVLTVILSAQICCQAANPPVLEPQDMKTFRGSDRPSYFRHLQIIKDKIYVGAKDYVYRLDPDNISRSAEFQQLNISIADFESCKNDQTGDKEHKEFLCSNHIRTIYINASDSKIYVCGTGAYQSQDFWLNERDLSIDSTMQPSTGLGMCPYDPRHNFTSIYVDKGNPVDAPCLYTGTILSPVNPFPVIFRPEQQNDSQSQNLIRTDFTDNNWLLEPNFVGSHENAQHVHFWFREKAVENEHCQGDSIFSRIARVCKSDKGGPIGFQHEWCTFMKVKLDCALPGDKPFYFDEIQDMFQIGNTGTFYAVFTSNVNGVYGSAVCSFLQSQIDQAFEGTFKDQESPMSFWREVESITPRPGTCIDDTTKIASDVLNFIREKPILYHPVKPRYGQPLYYSPNMVILRVAADMITESKPEHSVLFLGTDEGSVYKVLQWTAANNEVKNRILAIWKPFEKDEPVRQMKFIATTKMLYVSTDREIQQFQVQQCSGYKKCDQCKRDPYCRWYKNECEQGSNDDWTQTDEEILGKCGSECKYDLSREQSYHLHRIQGGSTLLVCQSHCTMDQGVVWSKKGRDITISGPKYTLSQDHGLVVWNITMDDEGSYTCKLKGTNRPIVATEHEIDVTDCGSDPKCIWQAEFNNWCQEYDKYQDELEDWQNAKDQCKT